MGESMRAFTTLALVALLVAPAAAEAARDDWGISVGVDLGAQGSGWVEADGVSPAGGGLFGAWAEWQPIPVFALRSGLRLSGEAGDGSGRGTLVGELGPVGTYWLGPLRLHAGLAAELGGAAWTKTSGAGAGGRVALAPHAGVRFDIPLIPVDVGVGADVRVSVAGIAGSGTAVSATPMATAALYYYF
jgi:hypothetical protein